LVYDSNTQTRFPLFSPYRLVVDASGNLTFTSLFGHRVMFIPVANTSLYGRSFEAGRLYTLAGQGNPAAPPYDPSTLGDGQPAYQALLT
jgi:hypothetical protein